MKRPTALSTFVVTAVVLAVIVAVSLRNAGAVASGPTPGTSLVHLPVAALTSGDAAKVHVVNVSKDQSSPALRFLVMFTDTRGVLLKPEKVCTVKPGETCSVTLLFSDCPSGYVKGDSDDKGKGKDKDKDGKEGPRAPRCEFRATVVGEMLACSASGDSPLAEWTTNLEMVDPSGASRFVAGPSAVLVLPRESCASPDATTPPPDLTVPPTIDASLPPADLTQPPPTIDASLPPPDLTQPPPSIDSSFSIDSTFSLDSSLDSSFSLDSPLPPADLVMVPSFPDLRLPPPPALSSQSQPPQRRGTR